MNRNRLIQDYIENNHFGKFLGMDFRVLGPGEIEYSLKVKKEHLATPHAAHGGVIGALADAALGVAGLSAVHEEFRVVSTVEYKINFLSPALLNDELTAHARVMQKGKRMLVIECRISARNREAEIAVALGTFNAYDASKAGYRQS